MFIKSLNSLYILKSKENFNTKYSGNEIQMLSYCTSSSTGESVEDGWQYSHQTINSPHFWPEEVKHPQKP